MGKAYSEDLRERVEARIAAGYSRRDAARHFGVSASFAVKLAQRVAVTGLALEKWRAIDLKFGIEGGFDGSS
ncbi:MULTISPECIES: hypothetical protein [unclassified Azospirillum]|jgi:transposase|uniref:hypothetical protein n=1 Tax=unclassified Azospirillum TaxID=2630922 RepID=UPI000B6F9665|nr:MULTISPECIES: hypothetical protein [unclassified Azospirillum]SNT19301.1 hypothetical protein SAMN05880556_1321 [Azospirillum sp. RU38E]SNT31156.1 hypothetical protein SAMN05880591_1321 [Azospirillum sp. RU37A]